MRMRNNKLTSATMSRTLYEKCTAVVLGSPYLLDRASLHLPRGISYFLLYLALESHNQLAVKKLVEKWPHGDLTLDFLAQSSLCRRHRCSGPHCLEPHEYMGVFGSYARYISTDIVSSLLEGVFYNLYYHHRGLPVELGLRHVDTSCIVLDAEKCELKNLVMCCNSICYYNAVPLLLNLVKGTSPLSENGNDSETKCVSLSRLHRPNTHEQPPPSLFVNVLLKGRDDVRSLNEVCSHCQWVEVKLKGVNTLGLHSVKDLKALMCHVVGPAHILDVNGWENYASDGSVSLWVDSNEAAKVPLSCKDLLLLGSRSSQRLANELSVLSSHPRNLRSFCLLRQQAGDAEALVIKALGVLVESVSYSLEYLQLQCLSFTSADLGWTGKCSKLRVLSVNCQGDPGNARPKHSVAEILTAISQLPLLEFFHWSEGLNLTTQSLLCLHGLLVNSFKSLCHFHVCFSSALLSTTDLVNDKYSVLEGVLVPLVGLKEGSEAVTTYIFALEGIKDVLLEWLSSLRHQVCFRLGKQVSKLCLERYVSSLEGLS